MNPSKYVKYLSGASYMVGVWEMTVFNNKEEFVSSRKP